MTTIYFWRENFFSRVEHFWAYGCGSLKQKSFIICLGTYGCKTLKTWIFKSMDLELSTDHFLVIPFSNCYTNIYDEYYRRSTSISNSVPYHNSFVLLFFPLFILIICCLDSSLNINWCHSRSPCCFHSLQRKGQGEGDILDIRKLAWGDQLFEWPFFS